MDVEDQQIGTAEKLAAHQYGQLHRAFSVFVWDDRSRLLLQRRAAAKYHSPLLWSNTCCGHPRPGEAVPTAAHRRLVEEMGFDCPLSQITSFSYRAALVGGLVEHEIDHILAGTFNGEPSPDPAEVAAWRWVGPEQLATELRDDPESYTSWFAEALGTVVRAIVENAPDPRSP